MKYEQIIKAVITDNKNGHYPSSYLFRVGYACVESRIGFQNKGLGVIYVLNRFEIGAALYGWGKVNI